MLEEYRSTLHNIQLNICLSSSLRIPLLYIAVASIVTIDLIRKNIFSHEQAEKKSYVLVYRLYRYEPINE